MRSQLLQAASLYTGYGQRKYLNAHERVRFIAAAKVASRPKVRALCLTLAYTGCRISEALSLRTASIEAQSGYLAIRSLKKRGCVAVREIPVPADLIGALLEVASPDPASLVWTFSRSRAWQLVKLVMYDAGIASGIHATPKGLRHGFGLHAVRSGVPLNLVQRWLGHARLETTAIYLQAMGAEEREIAERMWISE